mgnify:CR=1 FL=1
MNELIPINYEGEQPTVSARELYTGLEITDRFSRWFERMSAYGFSEGNDFTSVKSSTVAMIQCKYVLFFETIQGN